MEVLRRVGAGVAGLAVAAAFLVFFLLVLVGGNAYRKDCLTDRGTVSESWTFTWYSPLPFVFRPSETGCVVHAGTRVALNAVGIDTFKPSTPDLIAQHQAGVAHDSYWPVVRETLLELESVPQTADLTTHVAALVKARDALAKLTPPSSYSAAHAQLVSAITALATAGQQLQQALLRGDRQTATRIVNSQRALVAHLDNAVTGLNQAHAAQ